MKLHPLYILALAVALPCSGSAVDVSLDRQGLEPPAQFAADEIAAALKSRGDTVTGDPAPGGSASARIVFALTAAGGAGMPSEGFTIRKTAAGGAEEIRITASDTAGLLYGGLELAEQIRLGGLDGVADTERSPAFAMRGVKFNIPLDVRTPSYTDMSDSAQANIATVWDFDFWREFIDRLARDRYNYVGLWNLHPFPSLVRVPGYEDIALDDVQRTTFPFAENYSTRTDDFVTTDMLAHVETVRKMTMDEKIAFWRRVMAHGRDRNVDFYVITWNTYTYGTGGRHGITNAIDNPATIDYFRKSVAALFRTYPLLRGIGVTAGENMGDASSGFDQKEEWLFATYGRGVLDTAAESPGRRIRFIHRQHETHAQEIAAKFAPLTRNPDIEFTFSFKYAQAHVMSSTVQPFNRNFLAALDDEKTIWEWRNDDTYHFRWGAPDFVREFVGNARNDAAIGFCYGSDQWIWGREFLSKQPTGPRQLEIAKHWFNWMLWGRFAYDPTLGNERIAAILAERFPEVPGPALLEAWQHASMIYPLTTGFHWGEYDFQWYIEGCKSRPGPAQTESGFHDVNRFITLGTHPGTDNLTIPAYVESVVRNDTPDGTTPPQVAARLHESSVAALAAVDAMDAADNEELRATLADIRAMALLGRYYAHKISGATELALFRRTGDEPHRRKAVDELTRAAESWNLYTGLAASLYKNPLWTNRVGNVDWNNLREHVAYDITIAREARPPDTDQTRDSAAILPAAVLAATLSTGKAAPAGSWTADNGNGTFTNPLFHDEFSDPDLIRVGEDFYLAGTTMHSIPGVVILHSRDLVNWKFLSYAAPRLELGPAFNLEDGKEIYGQGIWAPCIRYHDGKFYVFSNTNNFGLQLFIATNPAGPWEHRTLPGIHDLSVLFDDDGRVWAVHGYDEVTLIELKPDLSGFVEGSSRVIIPRGNAMGEGHHFYKINGRYYIISANYAPTGRMQAARADNVLGPYETRVIATNETLGTQRGWLLNPIGLGMTVPEPGATFRMSPPGDNQLGAVPMHQGGIVDLPNGDWWGFSMLDFRSVGRTTALSPVTWHDGWPYFGLPGNLGRSPRTWTKPAVAAQVEPHAPYERSDNFDGPQLKPIWQWNHNPVAAKWSLAERSGALRLHTMPASQLLWAKNTLTQRAIGPVSVATAGLDASGLQPGDYAGLAIVNIPFATMGVARTDNGLVLRFYDQSTNETIEQPLPRPEFVEGASPRIFLRATGDYDEDFAHLSWSTDGESFTKVGGMIRLPYQLKTFQGTRIGLFAFNTSGVEGGHADFESFRVDEPLADRSGSIPLGKIVTFTNLGNGSIAWANPHGMLHSAQTGSEQAKGAGARFRVHDRGAGRVALEAMNGTGFVTVVGLGLSSDVRLMKEESDGSLFMWQDMVRDRQCMLLSLKTDRLIGIDPTTGEPYAADWPGSSPNRRNGTVLQWAVASE